MTLLCSRHLHIFNHTNFIPKLLWESLQTPFWNGATFLLYGCCTYVVFSDQIKNWNVKKWEMIFENRRRFLFQTKQRTKKSLSLVKFLMLEIYRYIFDPYFCRKPRKIDNFEHVQKHNALALRFSSQDPNDKKFIFLESHWSALHINILGLQNESLVLEENAKKRLKTSSLPPFWRGRSTSGVMLESLNFGHLTEVFLQISGLGGIIHWKWYTFKSKNQENQA